MTKKFWQSLKGLLLTWGEWHMIVCGLGDGLGFRKAEKIPKLTDACVPETIDGQLVYCIDEHDFYALLATESWYYKISFGVGRAMWALIIYLVINAWL